MVLMYSNPTPINNGTIELYFDKWVMPEYLLASVEFAVVKMADDFFTSSNLPKEITFSDFPVFTMTLPLENLSFLHLFLEINQYYINDIHHISL